MKRHLVQSAVQILLFVILSSQASFVQWVKTGANSDFPANTMITTILPISDGTGGAKLLAGTSGGVYLSSNSYSSWIAVDSGLPNNGNLGVSAFAIDSTGPNGPIIFAAVRGNIYSSTISLQGWSLVDSGPSYFGCLAVIPGTSGGTYIFAGSAGKIFRSIDHGATWSESDSGTYVCGDIVNVVKGNYLFACTSHRVWMSTNDGASWSLAGFSTGPCDGIDDFIDAFSAVSNRTGGTDLFVGWELGGGVFLSPNYGTTWTSEDSGLGVGNAVVTSFVLSGSTLFAGTARGVFFTTNFGTNWIPADTTGFPNSVAGSYVTCLALTANDLFAGTSQAGLWRLPLSDVSVKKEPGSPSDQKRLDISIRQFSSYISLSLPVKTGSIGIYDIHGRMVERVQVENNTAVWRGSHASGRYFAQVLVGGERIVKSFNIMR